MLKLSSGASFLYAGRCKQRALSIDHVNVAIGQAILSLKAKSADQFQDYGKHSIQLANYGWWNEHLQFDGILFRFVDRCLKSSEWAISWDVTYSC